MEEKLMTTKRSWTVAILTVFLLTGWSSLSTRAQEYSASAKLDSTLMFIGGQMDLKLEVIQPVNGLVKFPVFSDTICQSVEVVRFGKIDTVKIAQDRIQLTQTYRVTSFDSGVHLIPPIRFELAGQTYQQVISTQPVALKVINPFDNFDPNKGFDIKQPVNTPFTLAELKPYLIYFILFVTVLAGIIILLVWRFNRKLLLPFIAREKPVDPPHVVALRELERIKNEKLWMKDQVKRYYSEITDVLRRYIEARFDIPALEQTSDEIIASFKGNDQVDEPCIKNLKHILEVADLVKFAKLQPLPDENDLNMIHALFFVNQTKLVEIKSLEEEKKENGKTTNGSEHLWCSINVLPNTRNYNE